MSWLSSESVVLRVTPFCSVLGEGDEGGGEPAEEEPGAGGVAAAGLAGSGERPPGGEGAEEERQLGG